MPPKKKKATVNPIVVGTVSTRSTRRQSIVNIEIPKSNRSSVKHTFRSPTSGTPKENKEFSAAENFSEKIKQTYNKMFNRILEPSSTSLNQSPVSKISGSMFSESEGDFDLKAKSNVKSNEALLQILEDWTDDESQDDKKVSLDAETGTGTENVQETVKNSENEGTVLDLVPIIQHQSVREEVVSENVEEFSPSQYEVPIEMEEFVQKEVEVKMDTEEVSKTENSEESETEVIQEYIIEESEPVPIEEHVEEIVAFEEENIVECVTEEVVVDNDQYVLMDTAEDSTAAVFEINQQVTVSSEETNKSEFVDTTSPNQEKTVDENKETITVNIMEETSQSVSTTDSNDAEVRSFFAKEIENNKTVKEEDIPIIEYSVEERTSLCRENADSVGSIFEENAETETLVEAGINSRLVSEESAEGPVKNSNCFEGNNEYELEKNSKELEESFPNKNIESENVVSNIDVAPMDTTEDTSEDTIESKVAQMHLVDVIIKEEDTSEELSEIFNKSSVDLNYTLREDIEEVIGVKASRRYSKERIIMEVEDELSVKEENKMSDDSGLLNEKPKTRRARTNEVKITQRESEEQLETKSSKTTKSKEKRPVKAKENKSKESTSAKEQKNKKKLTSSQTVKKPKEKSEKKDIAKTDKKDTVKKAVKNDNDHLKKPSKSDNTDLEDIEVRRSSRIKSISVLKKKTTGHGLVRSKSEPILNESDVSDSNSTHTESEKSTPSASPKVQLKEKKSRWTRSSENLCDSQSVMDSVMKGDNQLSEITSMEVDEKPKLRVRDPIVTARLKQFLHLKENLYKTDRMVCKEAKKMVCDCFLTTEEIQANEYGCGEDCLNRLLLIEW